jgi:hypothetical protein
MKIRLGFVSNSSSASFVINKRHLTESQIMAIKNHYLSDDFIRDGCVKDWDRWNIHEDEYEIRGSTSMNNFSMRDYLEKIGVNEEHVKWVDDN